MSLLSRCASPGVSTLRAACGRAGEAASVGVVRPQPVTWVGVARSACSRASRCSNTDAACLWHAPLTVRALAALGGVAATWVGVLALCAAPAAADSCPNAQFRTGVSEELPDCRAYEQVSPVDKSGGAVGSPTDQIFSWQSSSDGTKMEYASSQAFGDAQAGASNGFFYLAARGASGWSTQSLLPPQGVASFGVLLPSPRFLAYSPDLSQGVLLDGGGTSGQDVPALVADEPLNNPNLFLRDNTSDTYQLVDVTPAGATPAAVNFEGASSDLSTVVFSEPAQLTADAPLLGNYPPLYEWANGTVRLIGVLPNGTPVDSSVQAFLPEGQPQGGGGLGAVIDSHAVSADGSRIFFQTLTGGTNHNLYLRENPGQPQSPVDGSGHCTVTTDACTLQVDASQGSGPGGGGRFMVASTDGSRAFFTDDAAAGLTNDTVSGSGANLYEYDINSGTLTDLTPSSNANVQGVVGASADGSYVYFVANGSLAAGASAGDCQGTSGTGSCNLYVSHNGTTTFVGTLDGSDSGDWNQADVAIGALNGSGIVSSDGSHLAFVSTNSSGLTGYDNTDANTGKPDSEVFIYGASSRQLICVSCNPSSAAPIGSSGFEMGGSLRADSVRDHLQRYLSADGSRLFFNSNDALVPHDTNGKQDVYEYEQNGAGSCRQSSGCIYLISTGTSADNSTFEDASASGDDVFFTTTQQLGSQDQDYSYDLYDARVDGGLSAQNPPTSTPCAGDGCRGAAATPPPPPTAASITFSGPGNASSVTPGRTARVRLLNRVVHGSTFFLRVEVPGRGEVRITGAGIKTVGRTVTRAGTYQLRVSLTASARRRLSRKRKLKLKLRARYSSVPGAASAAMVRLTVLRQRSAIRTGAPERGHRMGTLRAASHDLRGGK